MTLFIKNCFLFLSATTGLCLLLVYTSHLGIRKVADFTLNKTDTQILIGHSHPECAFDDSLIPEFRNLAESGESPFYSYQKLKWILAQNPQIDTVLIEFSNNMISKRKDRWIWGPEKMDHFLPIYAPFMTGRDFVLLAKHNPDGFFRSLLISTRTNIQNLLLGRTDYTDSIGGYFALEIEKVQELVRELERKPKGEIDTKNYPLSQTSLEYVLKMVVLCQQYDLKVFLVRSPQHVLFDERVNEALFTQIRNKSFGNIPFIDFNNFPLADDEFGDLGHLNTRGAKKFSLWFRGLIQKDLLVKEDVHGLIQSEIQRVSSPQAGDALFLSQ